MGLGKTLQIIAFLSAIMRKSGTPVDVGRRAKYVDHLQDKEDWRRSLPPADSQWPTAMVVAPSSVVGNWAREFTKWGYFEVGVYAGAKEERDAVLRDFTYGRLDVLLTSFDSARIHIQDLNDLPFTVLIVDEAHRLKNPRSKSAEAFGSFAWKDGHHRTGPMRIALTGTAIQNNLTEFWVLLDWANPGLVGTHKQWTTLVANPLAAGQARNARGQELQRANMVKGNLHDKLLPLYFLRRTKDIIKDQLPKKSDQVVFCPLTRKQVAVYKRIVGSTAVQNMIRKDEPCDCGSREKRSQCCHPWAKEDLFRYMSILISISNHLALILPAPTDTPEQTARNRALSDMAFDGHSPKYAMAKLEAEYCGKWKVLETLLSEWRSDRAAANKVLIFTKSVKLIDMLEFHLATCSYGFVKLDGSTKPADRMPLVDSFQEDPSIFVFIVSTLAGGTGLNLTAANKVVIFDPNWNPAHDLQAMDRAYRYGQTRDVSVYRLLGAGSIEELIYARQVYKQQQMLIGYEGSMQTRYFAGVSGDKQRQGELFGLKNIFTLHENESTTRMAIERASVGNLDWALENLGTSELKGLGSLLFSDAVPAIPEDSAKRILDETGIKYSHRNDALLEESHIEEARVQKVIEEERQARRRARDLAKRKAAIAQGRSVKSLPDPNWPPKRRHHKPPPTPAQKLQARQRALLDLGIVQRPQDLTEFAQKFDKRPVAEQVRILEELDDYARNHR
ncbi:hypothetical protein PENSPDRAFT_675209 [Peniophora sp. CONT]|nr:hypothetical protein PENSPDRAFT_675209 [Peniophora sp. CONT]